MKIFKRELRNNAHIALLLDFYGHYIVQFQSYLLHNALFYIIM